MIHKFLYVYMPIWICTFFRVFRTRCEYYSRTLVLPRRSCGIHYVTSIQRSVVIMATTYRKRMPSIHEKYTVSFRLWYDPGILNLGLYNLDTLFNHFTTLFWSFLNNNTCNMTQFNATLRIVCLYRFKTAVIMCFDVTTWFWCNFETMRLV